MSQYPLKNHHEVFQLKENDGLCFVGNMADHRGIFVEHEIGLELLNASNKSGKNNADVVKPAIHYRWGMGNPITHYALDFNIMTLDECRLYEAPFEYAKDYLEPQHAERKIPLYRWSYRKTECLKVSKLLSPLHRFMIATDSWHSDAYWLNSDVRVHGTYFVIPRSDDYFFGMLHSRLFDMWRKNTRNFRRGYVVHRYGPYQGLVTFPFPYLPGTEDFAVSHIEQISNAARMLHEERQAYLESSTENGSRLLYDVYKVVFGENPDSGLANRSPLDAAYTFAPRLKTLHQTLDEAVYAAYGFEQWMNDKQKSLEMLLALNKQRYYETPPPW
jgi:hypothetical protein